VTGERVASASAAPRTFRSQSSFRAWLERSHDAAGQLVVRCFKTHHARLGLTYREALDEALCFGWIDGVRHALDEVSFTVRFTPRKAGSVWSTVNVRRATELQAAGRLRPAGAVAFEKRKTSPYSYENRPGALARALQKRFRANEAAWTFFRAQPPWYQRTSSFWVMSARQAETRERRLALLIRCSEAGEPIPQLKRAPARPAAGRRKRSLPPPS
jgi:uncharacterized protein YdeI (YjbR/CyaY-like superfamily)